MRRLAVPIVSLVLLVAGCAGDDAPEGAADTSDDTVDGADEPEDEPDAGEDTTDPSDEPDDGDDQAGETADDGDEEPAAGATPDPAAVDDPCGDHLDREGEAFLELVAPVDDQVASGELELVGCSSVPEGTVQYRLLDGDGATLDEGLTTAECGGPCIGAFRETVALDAAAGEPVVHVQVFWEDLADGSERGLEERIVVLG